MGFWMSIDESGVNTAANTSLVTVRLYYSGNGLSWNHMSPSGAIVIDGTSYGFRRNFDRWGTQLLATASKIVTHNDDGSKWVGCSAWFATGVSLGTLSTSGGRTLTKIVRAVPQPKITYTDISSSLGWAINGSSNPYGYTLTGVAAICNNSYAVAKSYGEGDKWHGVSLSKDIPADSKNETGAANFSLTYKQVFASTNVNDRGMFIAMVLDSSGQALAEVELMKPWAGSAGKLTIKSGGQTVKDFDFEASTRDSHFGTGNNALKTTTITKSGETITFNCGGFQASVQNDSLAVQKATKIAFFMLSYGSYAPLEYNGLYWCKFIKNYTDWYDVPNTFSVGDRLIIDTSTGEVTLNGLSRPELGAIGNNWEDIKLKPGINVLGASYSDYTELKILMKYRETYL